MPQGVRSPGVLIGAPGPLHRYPNVQPDEKARPARQRLLPTLEPRCRGSHVAPDRAGIPAEASEYLVLVEAVGKMMALVLPGNRYTGRQRHDLRQHLPTQRRLRLQSGLSNPGARARTIHAFKHLKYNGCHFDPAELGARALAHGWTADDAQQLGDYAEGVLAGTRYHTMLDPWGRHAINYWREEAAMYW